MGAPTDLGTLAAELRALGRKIGLAEIGFARAEPFVGTEQHLRDRKAQGLHGGMHFTYSDPDLSTDPGRSLEGAESLVVGILDYRELAPASEVSGPHPVGSLGRVARYSWRDNYSRLGEKLDVLACQLSKDGWRTRVLIDDNALVDREAAYRAGIGWYGKNTCLLIPGMGSWFVIGSVLTDAPLPTSQHRMPDGCGGCRRCLSACPTGALISPGILDARRCLAWLVEAPGPFPSEYREALGDRIYGCDDCQEACPPNRSRDRRDPPPLAAEGAQPYVELVWLLNQEDAQLLDRFGRWYIAKRQARYLRRNALVALGNTADGQDPDVEAVLRKELGHEDPLVRGHAVWAAAKLGRGDLLDRLSGDGDSFVRQELAAAGRGSLAG